MSNFRHFPCQSLKNFKKSWKKVFFTFASLNIDTTKPDITSCPEHKTIEFNQSLPNVSATANDNSQLEPMVEMNTSRMGEAPNEIVTIKWTATDAAGHSSNCTTVYTYRGQAIINASKLRKHWVWEKIDIYYIIQSILVA